MNRENIVRMTAGIHPGWHFAPAAARATLIYLGSKRFVLLLIELFCAVGVLRAYRAPQGKRWGAMRSQWVVAFRDAFIVIFTIGAKHSGLSISMRSTRWIWIPGSSRRVHMSEANICSR